MIAHSDIAYVIDPSGHTRYVLDADPGPGTATSKSSFAGRPFERTAKRSRHVNAAFGNRGSRRPWRDRFVSAPRSRGSGAAVLSGCGAASGPSSSAPPANTSGSRLRSRRRSRRPPAPGPLSRWGTSISRSIPSGSSSFVPKARLAGPTTLPRSRRHERGFRCRDPERPVVGCRYPTSESPRLFPTPRHGQQRPHLASCLTRRRSRATYGRPCDRTRRWGARLANGRNGTEVFASSGGALFGLARADDGKPARRLPQPDTLAAFLDYRRRLRLRAPPRRRQLPESRNGRIYDESAGPMAARGTPLPASLESGTVDVLGLQRTIERLCALLAVQLRTARASWLPGQGPHMPWQISKVFGLARSDQALSFGGDGPTGLFVLMSASGTAPKTLLVLIGPGAAWNELPAPPPNTSTVAFGSAGTVDALRGRRHLLHRLAPRPWIESLGESAGLDRGDSVRILELTHE